MKKIIVLLIALGLSVSCVGCGNNKTKESSTTSNSSSNSSDSNKLKDEYNVGEVIKFEGEEFTVTNVDKNHKSSNQYIKPKEGKQFVKVSVTIKNISDDKISVNPLEFKLLNSNGELAEIDGETYLLKDQFDSAELVKGGTKSGSIVFQAPKDDNGLKLVYKPNLLKDVEVKIKL